MKVYYKDIGPFLKMRMKDKGLSTIDLVKRCKIPKTTLNRFFNGEAYKGYVEILEELAIPLDLTTLEIYFFRNPNKENQIPAEESHPHGNTDKVDSCEFNKKEIYPDRFLPENKKLYEKLVKKNEEDIYRRETALKKLKQKRN